MAWIKYVCGRFKSDYRYSVGIVYNNFPWPEKVPSQKRAGVEMKAKHLLNVREKFKGQSFADLYDPLAMSKELVKAHKALDYLICIRGTRSRCWWNKKQ